MAEISSTVDLKDPLGAPTVVTGPEYLDALAKLGYNAENMSSPLPIMAKNAQLASNLITSTYQQQLDWQKTQADLAEATARAGYLDSETDWNNQSLQRRLKGLELEQTAKSIANQRDQNLLDIQNETLQSAKEAELAKNKDTVTLAGLNAAKLDAFNQDQQQRTAASADLALAQRELPDAAAPDFDAQMGTWYAKHGNAYTNELTGPQLKARVAALEKQRGGLAAVAQQQKDQTDLLDLRGTGDLRSPINIDAIKQDPAQAHTEIVRGRISRLLRETGVMLPQMQGVPGMEEAAGRLQGFQQQVQQIMSRGDDGLNEIKSGAWGNLFDSNGNLNPGIQGDIDTLQNQLGIIKAGKGPEVSIKVPVKGTNPLHPEVSEFKGPLSFYKQLHLAAQEANKTDAQKQAEQNALDRGERAKAAAGLPTTAPGTLQGETNILAGRISDILARDPGLKAIYQQGLRTGDMSTYRALMRNRLYGLPATYGAQQGITPFQGFQQGGIAGTVPGLAKQEGGVIFDPKSVGAGSTDTVPAMLTPGEYVMSKPAVDAVGQGTLDQINQAGKIANAPNLTNPLASMAGQFGRQQQPSNQPQTKPGQQQQTAAAKPATVTPWWGATPTATTQPGSEPDTTATTETTGPAAAATAATMTGTGGQLGSELTGPTTASSGWKSGIGSEFGEVDNPAYGGYTEANWNKGSGGANLAGWDTEGVALPHVPLGTVVEIRNPATGATTTTTVKDRGPGASTGASIDMLAGTRAALGFSRNFKGPVQYRILSSPTSTAQYQHGGLVSEEGSIGTGPGRGGGGGGGGGIESSLDAPVDPRMRHRRFHPRVGAAGGLGGIGPDIPDPMQKKLAKLSQDYLSGVSDLIRSKPEMGPALLTHARHQLAANMGGQPEEWMGGGGEGEQQGQQYSVPGMGGGQQRGVPPEAYGGGMLAYGGGGGEEGGGQFMQGGGIVQSDPNFTDPYTAMMNAMVGGSPSQT